MAVNINYLTDRLSRILKDDNNFIFDERIIGYPDGTRTRFKLKDQNIDAGSLSIYINSTKKTDITDYKVNYDTGIVTFTTAPALNSSITADYRYKFYPYILIRDCIVSGFNYINNMCGLGYSDLVLASNSITVSTALTSIQEDMIIIAAILTFLQNEMTNILLSGVSFSELGTRVSFSNLLSDRKVSIAATQQRLDKIVDAYNVGDSEVYRVEAAEYYNWAT